MENLDIASYADYNTPSPHTQKLGNATKTLI